MLIGLIPLIGAIVLIVFACTDSGPPNKYGEGPDDRGNLTATPPPPPAERGPGHPLMAYEMKFRGT